MIMEIQIVTFKVTTLHSFVYVFNVWMNLLSPFLKWKCKYHEEAGSRFLQKSDSNL
jgi:hypothetical protein